MVDQYDIYAYIVERVRAILNDLTKIEDNNKVSYFRVQVLEIISKDSILTSPLATIILL